MRHLCLKRASWPEAMDLKLETLCVSILADGVRHVELNRPATRNAMNWKFWIECRQVFEALAADGDCRVIILSGRGKSFCGGLDLTDSANLPPEAEDAARKALKFMPHVKTMQDGLSAIEACLKPTVAVVHGYCIGAGIDLITATDVRICTSDAVFSVREAAIGLAADVGTLARLPKIVGNESTVRELALTARNFTAAEAHSMGLVSKVFSSRDEAFNEAQTIANSIAANSPIAVLGTKRNLNYARDHSVQESLDYVLAWNAGMIQTDDLMKVQPCPW